MKELINLTRFEYKKILQKKSSIIALGVVLLITLVSGVGTLIGNAQIDGKVVDSYYQIMKDQRKAIEELSGQEVDRKFLEAAQNAQQQIKENEGTEEYWEIFKEQYYPYTGIMNLNRVLQDTNVTDFYESREKIMAANYQELELLEEEINVHWEKNKQVKTPFTYEYKEGIDRFLILQYGTNMFLAFGIAICVAALFAGEYTTKMEQQILSARYGKNKEIKAKLLAGYSFTLFSFMIINVISFIQIGLIYGFGGWNAPIQFTYNGLFMSAPLTMGQTVLIGTLCGLIATLLMTSVVMFCSAKMKSPFGVIIIGAIFIFLPMFLLMPTGNRILDVLLHFLPINMMDAWAVLGDDMLHIGNGYFYYSQVIPLIELLIIGVLTIFTYRSFKHHQVG